jgi:hypothetical protein
LTNVGAQQFFALPATSGAASGNDGDKEARAQLFTPIADAINYYAVTKGWHRHNRLEKTRRQKTGLCVHPEAFEQLGFKKAALNPAMKNPDFLPAVTCR